MDRLVCEKCGASVKDVMLHRQNAKGVIRIWRCSQCTDKPIPETIQLIEKALKANRESIEKGN